MAKTRIRSKIVNRFLAELTKNITVDKVVLFGSTARGKNKKWSDFDIAIISNDFTKLNPIDRLTLLGKIAWQAHTTEIEALGYTPKEYKSADRFDFLHEIKKTGRIIFS